jgi:membrane protein
MIRFLKDLVWTAYKGFGDHSDTLLAAAIGYYVVFSIMPLLIFVVMALTAVLGDSMTDDIVDHIMDVFPFSEDEGRQQVEDAVSALTGSSGTVFGIVALAFLAWAGTGMFAAIRRSLSIVFGDEDLPRDIRPWAQQKLIDLALVGAVGLFFLASIVSSAFLRTAQARSEDLADAGEAARNLGLIWTLFEYLVPAVLAFVAFAALYTLVPPRRRRVADVWVGALAATFAFEVVKYAFSFYVTNFRSFDLIFASLGAVAVALFWVYVNAVILLYGAEIVAAYPRVKAAPPPRQGAFQGMKVPLRVKAWREFRKLFVRDGPP